MQLTTKTKWLFADKTLRLRHEIVKILAPKLYEGCTQSMPDVPRPMTLALKQNFRSKPLTGAEVGVAQGKNALSLLTILQLQKLYLIDPYLPYFENGVLINPMSNQTPKVLLSKYQYPVVFIHKTLEDAKPEIQEPLDFIYIDGNHTYSYVKHDIENSYALVKEGGWIGGHDYSQHSTGVIQAVDEFGEKQKVHIHLSSPDWWLIKENDC